MSTEIEKQSLEAHVELCAERYGKLENKLETVEKKVEKLESEQNYGDDIQNLNIKNDIRTMLGMPSRENTFRSSNNDNENKK